MSKRMPAGSSLDGWMQQIWAQARLRRGLAHAAGALSAFVPALALANPSGGQVVAGSATIGTAGANGVIVNQNSQRASINWQQFSIGSNEYVQFVQPNSSSVVLNRVIGSNPSSIFGQIKANGQVFLINPNGILFAPGSTLDVSSLTASTLDISDADFMAGRYVFSKDPGAPDATVVNQGSVTVTSGGYVVLSGDYVENDGIIQAQSGKVLLAAGGGATLTMDNSGGLISYKIDAPTLARLAGVDNTGSIVANGGAVVMTADVANALTATAVNNSGFITAHSVSQQGGIIVLEAQGGELQNSGTLDASATQAGVAGGAVVLRGDGHTQLDSTSKIDAAGDGAKGGYVELSGHTLGVRGAVDLGHGGNLLIDPAKIKIVAGNTFNNGSGNTDSIGTAAIAAQLNSNNNVTLVASQSIARTGGSHITALTGAGNFKLEIGTVPTGGSCGIGGLCVGASLPSITNHTGGTINLQGLTINIKGSFFASASKGAVSIGNVTAANVGVNAGVITLYGNLLATGATGIALQASHEIIPGSSGSAVNNLTASHGSVQIFITPGTGPGLRIDNGISAPNGEILIQVAHGAITESGAMTAKTVEVIHSGSGGMHVGPITATGKFGGTGSLATMGVALLNNGGGSVVEGSGGKITATTGGVKIVGGIIFVDSVSAAGVLSMDAHRPGLARASIHVASGHQLIGKSVKISASNAPYGGNIALGKVTATSGNVSIVASGGASGSPNVITVGNVNATGAVSMNGNQISTGKISAGGQINLRAQGANGSENITINGNAKGKSGVFLNASGNLGGNIHVTGSVDAASGQVFMRASNFRHSSGGNITVGGAITAASSVRLFTVGGGEVGGNITVGGAITAGSLVLLDAQYYGNSNNVTVQTGAISAGDISIAVKGKGAKFTAPSLKASGPSSSALVVCSCEAGQPGTHAGYIVAKMTGNAGSASFDVTGAVKSVHGTVDIDGGKGTIKTGNISSGWNVFLTGNTINVGSVTAGTDVSIYGNTASASAHIKATGLVKGRNVVVGVNSHGGSTPARNGGSINLAGGASADGSSESAGGLLTLSAQDPSLTHNMTITAGPLFGRRGVTIKQSGSGGGVSINGGVSASLGGVNVSEKGPGSITINGNITARDGVSLKAVDVSASGANITVNGNITASNISIAASASTGADIKVTGGLTAKTGHVWVDANSSTGGLHAGGNVSIGGPVKSSLGSVSISGRGGGNSGGNVKVNGAIIAATKISVFGSYTGTAEAGAGGGIDVAGRASGSLVSFNANGGGISVGKIVSNNGVTLLASGSRAGSITVNGTITTTAGHVKLNDSGTQGGIHVTGLITATAGSVDISAVGSGGISVAGIKAGQNASLHAVGSHAGAITVNGNISGSGEGVFITDTGHSGANIHVTGNIKVGNTESGANASLSASAGTHSGGNITVGGKITTATGQVSIHTKGGGEVGGQIHIGAVSAAKGASISASYLGNSPGFTVKTGKITAEDISVSMNGKAPLFSAAGLVATGNSASHEDISVNLDAIGAGHSSGVIKLTAAVKSSNGSVTLNAGAGSVSSGRGSIQATTISGKTGITLDGDTINVGALTATSGNVSISGASANRTTDITVTGAITAKNVFITESFQPTASHSGAIDLQGPVTATGTSSGGPSGCAICIRAKAQTASALALSPVKMQISTASLTAAHGNIRVTQYGRSGGIHATGTMSAATGGVFIFAGRGKGDVSVGSLTAAGFVEVSASGDGSQAGKIKVNGNVNASSMFISAAGKGGGNVTVTGSLHAVHNIQVQASGSVHSGGNLKVTGPIKSTQGNVDLTTRGGSDTGGRLSVGKISAHSSVSINASYTGNVSGFLAKTGKITGEFVKVKMTGFDPHFSAAGIVANGAGPSNDDIAVNLDATGAGHSSGAIKLTAAVKSSNGSVTLNAGAGSVSSGRGSVQATTISGKTGITLDGDTINVGTLTAASGGVNISGASAAGHVASVTVSGAITAGGNVSVSGAQVHLGSISAGGGISVMVAAVSGHSGSITAGPTTLWTAKYVNIDLTDSGGTKGKIAIGNVTATGTAGSSHGGKLSIDASLPAKKVTVSTGALTAVTSLNVNIQNATGSASLGKLNAPTVKVVLANGNLTVGQLVHAGASITASNGSIAVTTTGNMSLTSDTFTAGAAIHLHAGGNLTLTAINFGGTLFSASAGNNLVETAGSTLILSGQVLKAGKQLVLSANTIDLGGAKLTASSIQLSATSINNASANGSITAAAGKIHATNSIFLVGENIVVSGAGPLISAASVDIDNAVVSGTGVLSVTATGNLDASNLQFAAGGFTAHGGSVDLIGAKIAATKAVNIRSGKDVNISGAQIAGSAVGISAGGNISNGSGAAGALTGGAGLLTLKAKGDVQLSGETLTIGTGGGSISATGSLEFADAVFGGAGTAALHAGKDISLTGAKLTLGGVTMDAVAGSIDLTGLTADVTGQMTLHAKHDIVLSGVHITTGIFAASASGTIHNGGAQGAITAAGMKFDAKKKIDMSSTVLTIGAGAVTGVTGDATLLQLLADLGLKPGSAAPNGAFLAGGSITLGTLDITGNYLVLQGTSVSILGKVTAPTSGLLVEVRPDDPAASIGIEGQQGKSGTFNLSNQGFFALFPGDTIVIGDDAETGNVLIGANGPFVLAGGTNLIFDTTGTITGLGNVTGTGLVGLLETLAAGSGNNNVVTAGEIDPSTTTTSLGDQTDKKHLGHGGLGQGNGAGQSGIIGADTDTSSVCH